MAETRDSGGSTFMAFVMGAITGAALALLWAPGSGEDTRRYLGARAREGRDRAAGAAEQGREFVSRQREHLNQAVERGRAAYEQARGDEDPA